MHPLNAGLYIHIPFCTKKCPYCDFFSITDLSLEELFINAINIEIKKVAKKKLVFDTIYFGGGTPSVLKTESIDRIITAAHKYLNILHSAEITIEVNPGTVNFQKLINYKSFGINRINIGVQSFNDKELTFLGRTHSSQDCITTIELAKKANFENIGIDLIYGLPSQSKKNWLNTIKTATQYSLEHLSCYMLTYELGTIMYNSVQNGEFSIMSDDDVRKLFELTIEKLKGEGYLQYEISNFAKTMKLRSKHNMKYWSFAPYIGLGPSAHSFSESTRSWNYKDVKKFIEQIYAGKPSTKGSESLSTEQQITEVIYLGFRTRQGIKIDFFEKKFNINFYSKFGKLIKQLKKQGNIEIKNNYCRLTQKGMIFIDNITLMFL